MPEGVKANTVCPNDNCRFDYNQEDSLFCILCGIMLELNCSRCGDNPQYGKYCQFCGSDLHKAKSEDIDI
jgi:hypothetical protein